MLGRRTGRGSTSERVRTALVDRRVPGVAWRSEDSGAEHQQWDGCDRQQRPGAAVRHLGGDHDHIGAADDDHDRDSLP
jgi:hypothetical protein